MRIFYYGIAAVVFVFTVLDPLPGPAAPNDRWYRAGLFCMGVGFFVAAYRCKVILRGDVLIVQGLVRRRSVPIRDVARVDPSYGGLEVTLHDGRGISVLLVGEKSNASAWLGRRSASDRKAQTLMSAMRARRRGLERG